MSEATQDDASESRRFGSAQSVWRRSFRRLGVPATNCDCGVFFAGAAPEARSQVIRPRRYGVGELNSGSWKPIGGVTLGRSWLDHGPSHLGGVEQGLRSQVSVNAGSCGPGCAQAGPGPRKATRPGSPGSWRTNGADHAVGRQGGPHDAECGSTDRTDRRVARYVFNLARKWNVPGA